MRLLQAESRIQQGIFLHVIPLQDYIRLIAGGRHWNPFKSLLSETLFFPVNISVKDTRVCSRS